MQPRASDTDSEEIADGHPMAPSGLAGSPSQARHEGLGNVPSGLRSSGAVTGSGRQEMIGFVVQAEVGWDWAVGAGCCLSRHAHDTRRARQPSFQ